ncbi:phage head completion protein [Arcanobacterium pinnipediorum]|uniref:Head-tail adaptor protein n=1 Tax=Arcanobacterium pinnipediorum TaxID=1503041 RepID=A0ABY5AI58_9ACTO|nr:head-tail adaptor protein [Arcanobacterium pinnipediorum]USR79878.1 head-tail adaptor protein [Arcanobacterium pinnipediorum]
MASLGSMTTKIDLITPTTMRDTAGFTTKRDDIQATVRAQIEVRHASSAWVNRVAYTTADVLVRIRTIPGLSVTTDMEISGPDGRYVIDAVEVIGRYVEILAHQTTPEGR